MPVTDNQADNIDSEYLHTKELMSVEIPALLYEAQGAQGCVI